MKLKQILTELRYGHVKPNVTTIDRSSPWTKQAIIRGARIKKGITQAETGKQSFDIATKHRNSGRVPRIELASGEMIIVTTQNFVSYDPAEGTLVCRVLDTGQAHLNIVHRRMIRVIVINTNNLSFDSIERTGISGKPKNIIYKCSDNGTIMNIENPKYVGPQTRRLGAKPSSEMPSTDPLAKAMGYPVAKKKR